MAPSNRCECTLHHAHSGVEFPRQSIPHVPRAQRPVARQAVQYFVLSLAAIGISSLALFVFGLSWSRPPYAIEFAVALFASGLATVFRYVALTAWVFRDARTLEALPSVHTNIAPPAQAA